MSPDSQVHSMGLQIRGQNQILGWGAGRMKSKNIVARITAKLSVRVGAGACAGVLLLFALTQSVQAQVPTDPYNYGRASSFTYRADGLLLSEAVEPDNASLCVVTTYGYDGNGNKNGASTANCTGYGGRAYFTPRSSASTYNAQTVTVAGTSVTTPGGTFATIATNALLQSESRVFDPRFGAALSLTGPNGLTTRWTLDDFGRNVREQRADGTSTITAYCLISGKVTDLSSNSAQCAGLTYAANEIPADAVSLVHTEPHNSSDANTAPQASAKNGPYSRVYMDKAGHKIRSVSEGFDGSVVAQDVDYNIYGAQIVSTQPYFLATQVSTATGSAHYGMSLTVYDVLGRPVQAFSTDVANQPAPGIGNLGGSQTSVFFGLARGSFQASVTTVSYNGLSITTTNDKSQTRLEEKNIDGKVVRVTDALGAQLAHQYDAFGNLVTTKDALQNIVSLSYDIRGRKISMSDPDSGLWQYDYDALGELVWQQNANQRAAGTATTMAYDQIGRMSSRVEPEYTSTWSFDKNADGSLCMAGSLSTSGIGKLCETNTSNGVNRKQYYDSLGRPQSSRMTVSSGPNLASAVSYDGANGRLDTQTYPSGLQVKYNYNTRGFLNSLSNLTAVTINPLPATVGGTPVASQLLGVGTPLWTALSVNAWGRTEQAQLSNGVITRSQFDPSTGRTLSNTAGAGTATNVLNYSYVWDSLGHMSQRFDANGDGNTGAVTDDFGYDNLGRLTSYTVSAPSIPGLTRNVILQYNALGMLLFKTDVGSYTYNPQGGAVGSKPHALQNVAGTVNASYGYDANGNLTYASAGSYRNIAYTSFNLPDSQTGLQGPAGSPQYTWQYDENHQRIKETRTVSSGPNAGTRTTWMLHPDNQGGLGFESETSPSGSVSNRHYLSVGGASIGVLVTSGALTTLPAGQLYPNVAGSITAVKLEYWHKDQLGSLMATTDHLGNVTARYAYDPFGKRRMTSGQYDSFGTLVVDWTTNTNNGTDRGYTGHEHLDDVGVIHMNGRIFDPTLGMFMQADPMIQDPFNLQNYNRYGYCYNNPMGCTDPSGFCFMGCFWQPMQSLNIALRIGYDLSGVRFLGVNFQMYRMGAAIAFCVAADIVTGGAASIFDAAIIGFMSGAIATGNVKGALQGAFSAGMFYGAGNVIQGGNFFTGGVDKAAAFSDLGAVAMHGVVGCVTSVVGGGKCGQGALSAAFSETATVNGWQFKGYAGVVSAAVIGGTASVLGGGKFANGATTAAMGYLFNECAHTRMCGSDSTTVRVTGNQVIGKLAHTEIEISSGYDFVVLEARPGLTGRLVDTSNGPNWGSAFSFELTPPVGETTSSIGLKLQEAASLYKNDLWYGLPAGNRLSWVMDYGYNSNSYVSGLVNYALHGQGTSISIEAAAYRAGFRTPGMEKPIPLGD